MSNRQYANFVSDAKFLKSREYTRGSRRFFKCIEMVGILRTGVEESQRGFARGGTSGVRELIRLAGMMGRKEKKGDEGENDFALRRHGEAQKNRCRPERRQG